MSITVICPSCKIEYSADLQTSGGWSPCPTCHAASPPKLIYKSFAELALATAAGIERPAPVECEPAQEPAPQRVPRPLYFQKLLDSLSSLVDSLDGISRQLVHSLGERHEITADAKKQVGAIAGFAERLTSLVDSWPPADVPLVPIDDASRADNPPAPSDDAPITPSDDVLHYMKENELLALAERLVPLGFHMRLGVGSCGLRLDLARFRERNSAYKLLPKPPFEKTQLFVQRLKENGRVVGRHEDGKVYRYGRRHYVLSDGGAEELSKYSSFEPIEEDAWGDAGSCDSCGETFSESDLVNTGKGWMCFSCQRIYKVVETDNDSI